MDSQLILKYAFTDETGEIFIKLDVMASDLLDNSYKLEIAVSNMLCALSNWLENGHGHPLNPFEQGEMKELLDHFYSHSFENNKVIDTYVSIRELLKNCDK